MMLRTVSILGFILLLTTGVRSQTNVKDSVVFDPLISMAYAFQIPGGDLNKRFGNNSAVGGSFIIKDKHNFVYGLSGYFLLMGTNSFLNSSLGACNDTARATSISSPIRSIAGTTPEVLNVRRRLETP